VVKNFEYELEEITVYRTVNFSELYINVVELLGEFQVRYLRNLGSNEKMFAA
jgi:hypothetical protein